MAAFDRVRRERERRAGESDERHAPPKLALDLLNGHEHVRQRFARLEPPHGRPDRFPIGAGSRSTALRP